MNQENRSSRVSERPRPAELTCFACLWAAVVGAAVTAVYQLARHTLMPGMTDHAGHVATVVFVGFLSAVGCRVVVGMSRRMHNRLRREVAARKDAEQFFRAIAVATNAGIWSWDLASDFTWFNPEFVEGYGYSLEEALAHDFWRMHVHPDDREDIASSLFAAVRNQDSSWSGEYRFQRADGSYAWVLDRGVIFRDERGRAVRVCGGMIDVTSLKEAQAQQAQAIKALQTSEAAFRSLFENAPFGMYRSTIEGKLLAANPALVKMLGYDSPEELHRLASAADIYLRAGDRAAMVERLLKEQSITGMELEWKRKDGTPMVVRFSGRVCGQPDRQFFECTAEDITRQHELQHELQQSQKMEAIGQLAGGVAHDFNNMLLVIRMGSELLQSSFAPEDRRRKRIDEIIKTCDRAATLTQQLLAFGRRQMRAPQLLNLNAVVADAMNLIHRLIGDSIELTFQATRVPCTTTADPSQILQVLMNLCINARDAMPDGGALDVSTEVVTFTASDAPAGIRPGQYSMFSVRDNGSGMHAEVLAHLFEPFFTTKQKGKHSGLGLATVYGIVKQSEGSVQVESAPGCGSTFRIFLPYVNAQTTSAAPAMSSDMSAPIGNETVLLAEDEPSLRTAVAELLEAHGYQVMTANNGEHAMSVAAQRLDEIDLLLTDVSMPRMGGRELAQGLTARIPGLKVIFMSGYSDDVELRESICAGAAFLPKPFALHELLRKVKEMLSVPSAPHELTPMSTHGAHAAAAQSLR